MSTTQTIGFIGQGWIGKNYADDFEKRGYEVVRYALEEPYVQNKDELTRCNTVFIAVPTPTTREGFSYKIVTEALHLVVAGSTVVIKSTVLPGTTRLLQEAFPDLYVMHSPEFLREASAAEDAAHPKRNIIGIPNQTADFIERAQNVMKMLPTAPYQKIMPAYEAEFVKYAGNCFLYTKVVFMNALYDVVTKSGADFELVREAFIHDERIGESHTNPIHTSGHALASSKPVRGAGGHCFIKDFEAFRNFFAEVAPHDSAVQDMLASMVAYNNQLLIRSGKDIDILKDVYGDDVVRSK